MCKHFLIISCLVLLLVACGNSTAIEQPKPKPTPISEKASIVFAESIASIAKLGQVLQLEQYHPTRHLHYGSYSTLYFDEAGYLISYCSATKKVVAMQVSAHYPQAKQLRTSKGITFASSPEALRQAHGEADSSNRIFDQSIFYYQQGKRQTAFGFRNKALVQITLQAFPCD